jgi:hypothetical protein
MMRRRAKGKKIAVGAASSRLVPPLSPAIPTKSSPTMGGFFSLSLSTRRCVLTTENLAQIVDEHLLTLGDVLESLFGSHDCGR